MIPAIQLNVLKLAGEANCILSELKNYKHVLLTTIRVYRLSLDYCLWVFRSVYWNPRIAYRSRHLIMGDCAAFPNVHV